MNKKLVLFSAGLLFAAGTASAQTHVTGKVTDTSGNPVMGATVSVAGTKMVTTTDAAGNFKLKSVPSSAKKLRVSFIGMQPETVSVAGNVSVVLKDNELGEAVVIGYGTAQKVGTVVGSVKKVGSEQIAAKPSNNVADALQGKVAGLSILSNSGDVGEMGAMSIRVRGIGSLDAGNTPLLVIDGSPADASMLSLINDRDIESVTTLKDASATSIYGSRAANGVIYITTKKGRSNEKAQITVGQRIGWSQLANGIGNPMNANELLQFQLENGIITGDEYATYKLHGANTDWQKFYFDNAAPMYNTDFSLRGGSGSTTYYVSASYMNQKSLTRVSHFDRYTVRTNLETKPKDWLAFGVRQNITYTDRNSDQWTNNEYSQYIINNSVSGVLSTPTYWDPYDPEYSKKHLLWPNQDLQNGQWLQKLRPANTNDIVYNGVAYAQIMPVKGLTLKSQLGLYATDSRTSKHISLETPGLNEAWAVEQHARSSMWTITNTIEYKFNIAREHEVTLLAGQEGIKYNSKGFGASGTGITDDRLNTVGNTTKGDIPTYSSSAYQFLSFFGRADYSFRGKYFANFTVRNDRSSRFGKDNRAANFYSGGAMWRISDESFMAPTKGWLTDLQIKASVGSTGNSSIGNYTYLGLIGQTQYNGTSGWIMSQPSNNKLGWETQIQTNVGFTARLLDRLTVDFNYYHKKTKDMLMSVPLPYTTGFSKQSVNVGELSNRGVEVELSYDVFRTKDAFFNVYLNYAYNKMQIDKLFYGKSEWEMKDYGLKYVVGKGIEFYMPIYAGVDKNDGAPMWYKEGHDGGIQHEYNPETMTKTYSDDLYQLTGKSQNAPHIGGFGFSGGWKGITLSADFAYVLKKYMFNMDYLMATSNGNAKATFNVDRDMLNIWKKPGDITELPGIQYETQSDSRALQNASFLRLKNLTLSYDLPQRWMQATNFFENIRISFTGRNLFTITPYKGGDPEPDINISSGMYPATRQYTIGVDFTF